VVAIFTKFDDLITQVYETKLDEEKNRQVAESYLHKIFQIPLDGYDFPPKAYVRMEGVPKSFVGRLRLVDSISLLDLHDDESDHQGQVKELLTKTADSLDDIELKILFVSVQRNNLELCLTYAVK